MDEQTMTVRETRDALGKRVDAAFYANETTLITKNGEPRAVLVSHEWYTAQTQADGAGE